MSTSAELTLTSFIDDGRMPCLSQITRQPIEHPLQAPTAFRLACQTPDGGEIALSLQATVHRIISRVPTSDDTSAYAVRIYWSITWHGPEMILASICGDGTMQDNLLKNVLQHLVNPHTELTQGWGFVASVYCTPRPTPHHPLHASSMTSAWLGVEEALKLWLNHCLVLWQRIDPDVRRATQHVQLPTLPTRTARPLGPITVADQAILSQGTVLLEEDEPPEVPSAAAHSAAGPTPCRHDQDHLPNLSSAPGTEGWADDLEDDDGEVVEIIRQK